MITRAAELVRLLRLEAHPEGGAYREIFRSSRIVQPGDARPERSALTLIYFLLTAGEQSAWHRVDSDEAWVWLEGDPLELFEADAPDRAPERTLLGAASGERSPAHVVRAGRWQAARSTGAYMLVSCAVGPGFDFADFTLAPGAPLP